MKLDVFRRLAVKAAAGVFIFAGLMMMDPQESMAAARTEVQTRSSYMVTIEAPSVDVYTYKSKDSKTVGQVKRGQTYEVLKKEQDGWVQIRMGNREGYISAAGNASLVEKNRQTVDSGARQRREVVEFALQFLGGEYRLLRFYTICHEVWRFCGDSSFFHRTGCLRNGSFRRRDAARRPDLLQQSLWQDQSCGYVCGKRAGCSCFYRRNRH